MREFDPRLDVLPEPQRRLWPELRAVPPQFALYGGTAIALRLGHRASVDFDFMAFARFDPLELVDSITFLRSASIVQSAPNTLTAVVDRGGPVKLSFFGIPTLGRVEPAAPTRDRVTTVAALLDLGGMKVVTVQRRAEAKDYLDIDALLGPGALSLDRLLAAARVIYGSRVNLQLSLKALVHFDDGDVATLPDSVRERIVRAVAAADLSNLPDLACVRPCEEDRP